MDIEQELLRYRMQKIFLQEERIRLILGSNVPAEKAKYAKRMLDELLAVGFAREEALTLIAGSISC